MTPDELAAIEARAAKVAWWPEQTGLSSLLARADVPALIATVRALRVEVAALRREALLRDAGITTTSTAERA